MNPKDQIECLLLSLIAGLHEVQCSVVTNPRCPDAADKVEALAEIEKLRNQAFRAMGKWTASPFYAAAVTNPWSAT